MGFSPLPGGREGVWERGQGVRGRFGPGTQPAPRTTRNGYRPAGTGAPFNGTASTWI
jgi:hypothetical protein